MIQIYKNINYFNNFIPLHLLAKQKLVEILSTRLVLKHKDDKS